MKWQDATIDSSCLLITDGTHYTPPDVGAGVPFLTVKDFTHDGQIDLVGCSHITEEEFQKADKGNSAPKLGDVLFSKDGTVGKVYVVNTEERFAVLSSMAILRPTPAKLDSGYFGWVLKTEACLDQASRNKTGSAIRRIVLKDLKKVKIPLPPLEEQKRIAAILDATDVLRTKRRESLVQLDVLLQSTFLDMFGDPMTSPKGWEKKRLGSICDVGSSKRVFVDELVEAGVPFYRGTEVGQLGDGQFVEPSLFITKEHYERLKAQSGVPCKGDLLLPSICPDGRIYLIRNDEPFYFKDGRVLWIKVDRSQINSVFLRYHLKQLFYADYSKIASGTTFAELKIFALKDLVIQAPPVHHQERFAAIVESIEHQKARFREHLTELDTLFASLQHRAFNGEL